ncbi:MAG: HigA family addiction module antidote protein [Proteobacteria bacterium]|nr:HigA family addiction module antidote protein [Pseudomonadota bacterium]
MKTITRSPSVRQHNPPHPGEVLAGLWMEPLGMTVTAVADALGVSRKTISKIVNGNGAVTPEMALRLELAFGASAQSWLGHQAAFDLWQVEQSRGKLAKQVHRVELDEAA